ncbi:MAG: alpha/beta hydrolase [Candidatus Andersenbacteria bacterium]
MKWFSKSRLLIIALILLLMGGTAFYFINKNNESIEQPQAQTNTALEGPKTTLTANDGTSITARPYLVKNAKIGAVIIHDIDKDRSETMQFAEELAKTCKCSTIAVDLRGHGQSSGSKEDFTNMYQDASAADKYLKEQGIKTVSYIGFGFGAHIALKAANEAEAKGLVIVSPDPDDRGLSSIDLITKYNGRLLVSASETDTEPNRIASKLFNLSQVKDRQYAEYVSGGHGIRMVYDTDLGKIIKDWLTNTAKTSSKQ